MSKLDAKKTKLLTIISASNRPNQMRGFLKNLAETVADLTSFELLVKIDEGDTSMQQLMEEAVNNYPFTIRYIQTPKLDGYYTLHYGYQSLLEISDPDTYFIFPVNEEVRFKTQHWDKVLAQYVHFYQDDFFRLKISRLKYRNYYTFHECGPTPENYPFMTRKWIELAGGIGDCWGPDGWHQFIDFHLGQTKVLSANTGIFRSVAIQDILIEGEEAGKELSTVQSKIRGHRIYQEWWRMFRTEAQQEFRRIAARMGAYVWTKHGHSKDFIIDEDCSNKKFLVKNKNNMQIEKEISYALSQTKVRIANFNYLIRLARLKASGFLTAFIYPSYGPKSGFKKWRNHVMRYILVLLAVVISRFCLHDDSIPKRKPGILSLIYYYIKDKLINLRRWIIYIIHRVYYPNPSK